MAVDFQNYLFLLVLGLASIAVVGAILTKTRTKICLPPSPMALPIIGHLHHFAPKPYYSLYKLSKRYGPLVYLKLGYVPCVVTSSPEMVKEILQSQESFFLDRPHVSTVEHYEGANMSFAPYGPYWKYVRKICVSELVGGKTLNQLLPIRRDQTRRFLDGLQRKAQAKEEVDVGAEVAWLFHCIVTRIFISKKSNDSFEVREIRERVKEMAVVGGTFNLPDYIWLFKNFDLQGIKKKKYEIFKKYDTLMNEIIKEYEEARKEKKRNKGDDYAAKDLLDILLDKAEDESSAIRLTKDNIKSLVLVLLTLPLMICRLAYDLQITALVMYDF